MTRDRFDEYYAFSCEVYKDTYIEPKLGIPMDWFDEAAFMNAENRAYFSEISQNTADWQCYVALENGVLVGSVSVHHVSQNEAEVFGFYVRKNVQGTGIGAHLWGFVEQHTAHKSLSLSVFTHATRAIHFYFKRGFVFDGQEPISLFHPNWLGGSGLSMYHLTRPQGHAAPATARPA